MKLSIRGKPHWIVVHKNVYYAPRVGVNLIGVPNSPERPLLGGGAPMRNLPATQRTAREKHPTHWRRLVRSSLSSELQASRPSASGEDCNSHNASPESSDVVMADGNLPDSSDAQ
jgi:hypothetical protein